MLSGLALVLPGPETALSGAVTMEHGRAIVFHRAKAALLDLVTVFSGP